MMQQTLRSKRSNQRHLFLERSVKVQTLIPRSNSYQQMSQESTLLLQRHLLRHRCWNWISKSFEYFSNFQNCVIKATTGLHPFVILISKDMKKDGNAVCYGWIFSALHTENKHDGCVCSTLTGHYFWYSCDTITELKVGTADVLVDVVPLLPIFVSGVTEQSAPYISDAVKWFASCSNPV